MHNDEIKTCTTRAEIAKTYPVMSVLRPHIVSSDDYVSRVEKMIQSDGYHLLALFIDDECKAVAGYRYNFKLAFASDGNGAANELYVDDLVTASACRSKGYGEKLMLHIRQIAAANGVEYVTLDSGCHRLQAHKFYERIGLEFKSKHFVWSDKA